MSDHTKEQSGRDHSQVDLEHLQQEVNQEASPMFDFLVKNAKVIIGVALGAVAVAGIYAGVGAWAKYSEQKALDRFAQVLSITGEERIPALKAYVAEAPEDVKGGALFELAGTLMSNGQYGEAAEVWAELESSGRQEMRTLSRMGMARCLLLDGQTEKALKKAESLVAEAPEVMKVPANRLLAACAEAAGDNTLAVSALQMVLESGQAPDAPLLSYRIKTLKDEQ